MKYIQILTFCLFVSLLTASTNLKATVEEQDLQQQLTSHLILRKEKLTEKCDKDKTASFRLMVDFDMIKDMRDEVIKPFITRYFKDFSLPNTLYQQPANQCLDNDKVVELDEDSCKLQKKKWKNNYNDKTTTSRKRISNFELNKFEVNWDKLLIQPVANKQNLLEINFELKSFLGFVKVTSQDRKFSVLGWLQSDYGNVPWKDPVVQNGSLSIENFQIKIVLQLQPDRKDLDTCFTVTLDQIYFDWKSIQIKDILSQSGIADLLVDWVLSFKSLLRFSVDKIARPIINGYLTKGLQSLANFNIPLSTQKSVLNFRCSTQATQGPQIVKLNSKNYFDFGVHIDFQQIVQQKSSKATALVQKFKQIEQRLMKTKKCIQHSPSFNFDFNMALIDNIKNDIIKPYFKDMFEVNKFRIQDELYNSDGISLKDLRINQFTIKWDSLVVGPQIVNNVPQRDTLQVQFLLDDFDGQLLYNYPGIFSDYNGDASLGIDDFKINIIIQMSSSPENSCFKLSLKTLDISWNKINFNPFQSKVLNWFIDKGIKLIQSPLQLVLKKFILPYVNNFVEKASQFTNTHQLSLPTADNGNVDVEVTWSASEAPQFIVNQANENNLHLAFYLQFKDITNHQYLDKVYVCKQQYDSCMDPFFDLLEKQTQLQKYEAGLNGCTKIRDSCFAQADLLKTVPVSTGVKLLRLAKQVKSLRLMRKQQHHNQKKQNMKNKQVKQKFLA